MELILGLPLILGFFIFRLILVIVGFIMIPTAVAFRAYAPTYNDEYKTTKLQFTWPVMKVFNNYEDGIDAGVELPNAPKWVRIIAWSAYRNPTNGLRDVDLFAPKYKQDKLKVLASFDSNGTFEELDANEEGKNGPFWYIAWQDFYANFRVEFNISKSKRLRIWFGFKLYPSGKYKVPHYQVNGVGFGSQLKVITIKP